MQDTSHITTRRGFIAVAGFGGTALYGLWVGYGAAPGPLAIFSAAHSEGTPDHAGVTAHDAHEDAVLTRAEFEAHVQDFVDRFGETDGSVRPRPEGMMQASMRDDAHAGHGAAPGGGHSDHGGHGDHGDHGAGADAPQAVLDAHPHDSAAPIDIWLQAAQFYFKPAHLRLETHQPYRFRMMATDVSHGASIQFGRGGRMIRLRPGQLVETEITFDRPGDFLIYCTFYCGTAHDVMQARLSVTEGGAA